MKKLICKVLGKFKKPHVCDFKEVKRFGGQNYADCYYRCKCGQGAILMHGFRFTVLDKSHDHPYGKQSKH